MVCGSADLKVSRELMIKKSGDILGSRQKSKEGRCVATAELDSLVSRVRPVDSSTLERCLMAFVTLTVVELQTPTMKCV